MSCQIANIVPKWSALGEWCNGGVHYTEVDPIPHFSIKGLNTQGGIPTLQSTVKALEKVYKDANYRQTVAVKGYNIATDIRFNWNTITTKFDSIFTDVVHEEKHE